MSMVDERRPALQQMHVTLAAFLADKIGAPEFIRTFRSLFAPFDVYYNYTDGMSDQEVHEVDTFIGFVGGWFGDADHLIPKRKDWEYGVDTVHYAWIDTPEYRRWIGRVLEEQGIVLRQRALNDDK